MHLAPSHRAVLAAIAADDGPQVTSHRPARPGPGGAWSHYLAGRSVTAIVGRLVAAGLTDRTPTGLSGGHLTITPLGHKALAATQPPAAGTADSPAPDSGDRR
ncbi:hypothetical protein [Longispora albida]|uniref:hypothetical protein n=1 Tax=Longispora albida TaxID=203523 RepID=UPI00037C25B9|nr:hypothetical protein [Longispora albida]